MCCWSCSCTQASTWRSEVNCWESVISLHHVGPGSRTQSVSLSGKHLYLPSHLASPNLDVILFFISLPLVSLSGSFTMLRKHPGLLLALNLPEFGKENINHVWFINQEGSRKLGCVTWILLERSTNHMCWRGIWSKECRALEYHLPTVTQMKLFYFYLLGELQVEHKLLFMRIAFPTFQLLSHGDSS